MATAKICSHIDTKPNIDQTSFIAPGAVVIGDVELGAYSSVWYQSVLRADIQRIVVGEGSNIQDGVVIHLASDRGTKVGNYVTVGHKALLHACEIEDEVLVGMGAIIMDGAVVGKRSIVGAGTLIPRGKIIPPGSLVMGSPGRVVRALSGGEQEEIRGWAEKYITVAREHREFQAEVDSN
ncbi:gamma carbonic anhydrase family protein [Verrucomicrobiales bacterium BCK34]|nr:gamma carbonic anhydrase family protein [Verrucomicrobiales bacterium BCK34]